MPSARSRPSIATDIESWLAYLALLRRSPKTISTYGTALKNLRRYLTTRKITRSESILPEDLEAWRRQLHAAGLKPASVDLFIRSVKGWCRWLSETRRIFLDPAANLETPKIPKTVGRFPSEKEMLTLLDHVDGEDALALRDRALLETAYASAARRSELACLNLASVDHRHGLLRIRGKDDCERIVPLTTSAMVAIDRYLTAARPLLARSENEPALFLSSRGGNRLASFAVAGVIQRRAARTGLVLAPHGIRRAVATQLVSRGAPIFHVKDLLGHRSFRHLGRYSLLPTSDVLSVVRRSRLNR